MKWERGHKSQYVEDVRGQRATGRGAALKVGGRGAALLTVIALIAQALGVDLGIGSGTTTTGGGGNQASSGGGGGPPPPMSKADAELYDFINFVVDEGPRIYIERINVIGNERTKDHVIRREFRLAEGDAFNPLMVDRAKKRLSALGLFKSVEVKRRPGSAEDRVVLDVELVEQSTGELSFGAGFSSSEGVIGDVSITERNLLGNGQFLRLKFAGSFERQQVDLTFTEPRFLDRNLSAGFDLFHKEVDQTDQSGFRQRKSGGQVRLGFPLAPAQGAPSLEVH